MLGRDPMKLVRATLLISEVAGNRTIGSILSTKLCSVDIGNELDMASDLLILK